MPEITVKLGDQILQTSRFDGDLLRIGRSRENDIVLENLSVSRDHAQIRQHEGRFILTDLNSANGTMVNGVRITKTEIVDEDVITVGKHKLHFRNPILAPAHSNGELSDAVHTVMVEPRAEAWLTVESGRLAGREFRITRFETSLGKAASNDVVLTDDWLLGKKQAIILRKGNNEFEIQDLGGLRKVKVNGTPIGESADIKDGDAIELGGTRLLFHATMGQPTPTGRIPKEITTDADDAPEPIREAGSLNGSRRNKADTRQPVPSFNMPAPNSDDSLDLEDGYHSVRISLKDESVGAKTPADAAPNIADEPAKAADHPSGDADEEHITEETVPTPVVGVETHPEMQNGSHPAKQHEEPEEAKSGISSASMPRAQRQPFEDQRSAGRRRRKHHQRAAQKQASTNGSGRGSTPRNQKSAQPKPLRQHSELSSEKEIAMWEQALANPSPAIQRQAAKMLKKLTGKNYEV